jgi:two-component system cell cycle sensor histidine kinase/response regulator CckA
VALGAVEMIDENRARERKEREKEYKTLVDGMNDTAFVIDFDGRFIEVNNTAVEVLGYSREELLSMGPTDIDPHLSAEEIGGLIEGMKMGETQVFETQHRKNSGDIIPVEVSSSLVTYQGEPAILSVVRDITERKKVEERLKMTQFGIDHAQIGVLQVADDGSVYYANEHACESLGYTADELLALKIWDIDPSLDEGKWEAHRKRTRALGSSSMEATHRRKDGTEFPVEVAIDFIDFEDRKVSISFSKDITERKRAEEERELLLEQIREQAQQLREVMSTVPEGVFLLDAEHKLVLANPVADKILAVLTDSRVGDTLTHLGDRPLAELLASPPTEGLRHEVATGGRTFEVVARPMAGGREPGNWVVVINDVTLERQVQEQLQQQERLAALGKLAAGIAHDFNNILAVIVLYVQMGLLLPDLSPKLRERLEVISQQAKRATGLIQQILDFGRRAVLECRPMDLVPFLEEQVELLRRTLPENISISFTYEGGGYMVDADPTRMQQAIMNLALNARDAMATGGELRIYLERIHVEDSRKAPLPDMDVGQWVRVTVTDTGVGILPDLFPHIFEPFFTTKEPGAGAGLGLPQVYGIVKQHGGHIDVMTELGKGTSFVLYLPALVAKSAEALRSEAKTPPQGRGEMILVVEDNQALQKALMDGIESLNYRVLTADNGRQALAILEEYPEVALVVSDLMMPEMGGQALFHALRQRGLTLPVVMLSGHPMESELVSLQAQGLAGWLLKPPSMEQLARLLDRALKRKPSNDQGGG